MDTQDRLKEIGEIIFAGIVRLKQREKLESAKKSLDFKELPRHVTHTVNNLIIKINKMTNVIRQISQLQHKTPKELREMYEELFLEKPHYNASTNALKPKIAYRVQELALGGLSEDTKDKLQKISQGAIASTPE